MLIAEEAGARFIGLYTTLLYFAGQKRDVLPGVSFEEFLDAPLELKIECRDAIYSPQPLFHSFLQAHRDRLPGEEQQIVRTWARYHVYGQFVLLKHLRKYSIFLQSTGAESLPNAYGVLGLTTDLPEMIPSYALPQFVQTALLQYEGVIVCDGLFAGYNMVIGPNMQRDFEDEYKEARSAGQLVTTFEQEVIPPARSSRKRRPATERDKGASTK